MGTLIWKCWFLRSGENRSTLYLKRNPSRARREPTTNSTQVWRQRQDLCPGHTGESTAPPLLPIIENKWLSLLNHRSHRTPQRRLRSPATVPKPITFCKVTNKHQTVFFSSKNDCKKSWQNVSFSSCWAFATGWISSAKHFGNTMFLYIINHSLQVTSSFSQEKRSRGALFSHHHKFCAPKTNKTKAEPKHHPSVLRVNFHHRLNVIYARKFYATV